MQIKILVETSVRKDDPFTGLEYHRQVIPAIHLATNYEGYAINLCGNIAEVSDEALKDYNLVCFLRLIDRTSCKVDTTTEKVERVHKAGGKVVIDIDDLWDLHPNHELNQLYKDDNIAHRTISSLKAADWVTTTTEYFANVIREYNPNVTVLPNSIDTSVPQFQPEPTESERVRFGWIGGVYHVPDIRMMYESFKKLWKGKTNDFQLCLGGFNPNPAYLFLEKIFTDDMKNPKNPFYLEYLKSMTDQDKNIMDGQPYKRLWGKDVETYATLYNEIDVALVPLVGNRFNNCKSQIKIIEAGFFKKACIVSNTMPYSIDCTKDNSILINQTKDNLGWYDAIRHLLHNRNRIEDLGEAMHETVKDKYNMETVNKVRHYLYQRLCE